MHVWKGQVLQRNHAVTEWNRRFMKMICNVSHKFLWLATWQEIRVVCLLLSLAFSCNVSGRVPHILIAALAALLTLFEFAPWHGCTRTKERQSWIRQHLQVFFKTVLDFSEGQNGGMNSQHGHPTSFFEPSIWGTYSALAFSSAHLSQVAWTQWWCQLSWPLHLHVNLSQT